MTDFKISQPQLESKLCGGKQAKGKVEPKGFMPESYAKNLIRKTPSSANFEVFGMQPAVDSESRAPALLRKITLLAEMRFLQCAYAGTEWKS